MAADLYFNNNRNISLRKVRIFEFGLIFFLKQRTITLSFKNYIFIY